MAFGVLATIDVTFATCAIVINKSARKFLYNILVFSYIGLKRIKILV